MEKLEAPLAILVVNDHADTIKMMARLLRRKGYAVTEATSKSDALSRCKDGKFDLLISDIGLPDGDGLDLMREVTVSCQIPGIALTGYGYEADMEKSRAAGFAAHLTKPVSFDALLSTVEKLLAIDHAF